MLTQLSHFKSWFLERRRDLPWREDPSAYQVWISEVMLQQTRVAVVIPYFLRWMEKYPTIEDLASAPIEEVLKIWEGLGYYSRARNIHAAAQYIIEKYEGIIPQDSEKLREIKGLGDYTIGAIQSFAFHLKAPAVDGNVVRVISRLFKIEELVTRAATKKKIYELSLSLLPDDEPWVIAEALIELGATICTRSPKCGECPLALNCQAYRHGNPALLPINPPRKATTLLYRNVIILQWKDRFLVKKGEAGKLMSDLYEFPYFETSETTDSLNCTTKELHKHMNYEMTFLNSFPEQTHSFTRYKAFLRPFHFKRKKSCKATLHDGEWLSISELKQRAFSSGHKRIFIHLIKELEHDKHPAH
jgi:A/G-specific adenine glycosylase